MAAESQSKETSAKVLRARQQADGWGELRLRNGVVQPVCLRGPGESGVRARFLGNLQKKYGNNKKGATLAKFQELGARASIRKAVAQSHWEDVLKYGLAVLKINPWDVAALTAMASAAEGIVALYGGAEFSECQMLYLKTALEANSQDADVNRLCGIALGKRRQFDQAIACWHRVEKARPDDEEPKRAIASLAVEKTITRFDETDPAKISAKKHGDPSQPQVELSPEELLRRRIAKDPEDIAAYIELSQVLLDANKFKEAEEILKQAYEASNHDVDVREKLGDAQVRRLKFKLDQAEKQAGKNESEENKAEVKQYKKEYNQKLLEVKKNLAERYPNNLSYRLELGQQYMILGDFGEAIKELQVARSDPRRKGFCLLLLGESFQRIKQKRLAMEHYESAVQEIPDRDADNKKKALYRAGTLALAMGEVQRAEKYLNVVASMDFSYRDVSALLDKIAKMGDDGQSRGDDGA